MYETAAPRHGLSAQSKHHTPGHSGIFYCLPSVASILLYFCVKSCLNEALESNHADSLWPEDNNPVFSENFNSLTTS